jgi:hypothetical protein
MMVVILKFKTKSQLWQVYPVLSATLEANGVSPNSE